ncbi:hypothetical protein [Streptomyces sp. NPDC014746]|uniref:hypothetical protein n=1 Tax=Streptomyces sp. NPDC014746 TaxID=3364904 RepID=UPI0037009896
MSDVGTVEVEHSGDAGTGHSQGRNARRWSRAVAEEQCADDLGPDGPLLTPSVSADALVQRASRAKVHRATREIGVAQLPLRRRKFVIRLHSIRLTGIDSDADHTSGTTWRTEALRHTAATA